MVIEEYQTCWANNYDLIKTELNNNLTCCSSIEHVGSTSIPGMMAKPIIDVDVIINSLDIFNICKYELEQIGYLYCGNQGINGREVFKRDFEIKNSILDTIRHHLYVLASNANEYKRQIAFRNYLREHKIYVKKYNDIKLEILKRVGEMNRSGYVEMKEKEYSWFFEEVIKKALGS